MTFLLWIAACGGESDPGPVLTAPVTRSPGPLPQRFEVPPDQWAARPWLAPPLGRIQHALCADLPGVRDAVLGSLAPEQGWVPYFDDACRTPEWCDWVTRALSEDPTRAILWGALRECPGPAVDDLIAAHGPPLALIGRAIETGRYDPRLRAIAAESLRQPDGMLGNVLTALATIDDPAAEEALLALYREAPRSRREEVALSLWGRPSPRAQELVREACSHGDDERCLYVRSDPETALADALANGDDPAGLFARFPSYQGSLISALTTCVHDDVARRLCLVTLARHDPDAARAIAGDEPDLAKLLASDRAEVLAALDDLGFRPLVVPADSDALTVPELLEATGHAVRIVRSETSAPHNERLLYALAAIVGATDLEFDELPPSPAAPSIVGRNPALTLYAWAEGWRYRALASTLYDRDLRADVGFLNGVLAARGSDQRLALDIDQTHAIAGTAERLAALEDAGWVRFVRPEPPGTVVTPIVGEPVQLE